MPFGDKETDNDFHFFKMRRKDIVLYHNYYDYLRTELKKTPNLLKYLNKLLRLITPADLEKDTEQDRRISEISIKVVRYFKEDGEYYFKPDKKRNISFEAMINEAVSTLITYDELNILEKNRDEWIRVANHSLRAYAEIKKLETHYKISKYGYWTISCYIAVCSGFHISAKKITNAKLFQAARNAFEPKKSNRRIKRK